MCFKVILTLILATGTNLNYRIVKSIAKNVCYFSQKRNLDPHLVLGLIRHESNFKTRVVSRTNDYGLMQINLKYRKYKCDLFNVRCNIKEGTWEMATWKRACSTEHKKHRHIHWLKHYNWNSKYHHLRILWVAEAYKRNKPHLLNMIKRRKYSKLKLNYKCIQHDLCGADPQPKKEITNVVREKGQDKAGHL